MLLLAAARSLAEANRLLPELPDVMRIARDTEDKEVKGFLVEAAATAGARDISAFGGWRAFMAQAKVSA